MSTFAILYGSDPWQQTDGGTVRVQRLVSALEPFGVRVVFPERSATGLPPSSSRKALKQRYLPLPLRRRDLLREVREILDGSGADFVISASHALTPVALRHDGRGVWVDHFDLWSDFGRREALTRRRLARWTTSAQAALWAYREQRERGRYDVATAAGYDDARRLPEAVWMPTPVPRHVSAISLPRGRVAGFLANFDYWPNVDAYDVLVREWAPALRSVGWRVVVAGFGADRLPLAEGVDNLGALEDVTAFYDHVDLVLAPLRLGGGMKVKVVESLSRGRPVLATSHATEGLPPALRRYAVIAEQPPRDIDRALSSLDVSERLSADLAPFQPESFEATARQLARDLLERAP
jgi:polysaccharide biosynthesis protein PslH